MPPLLLLLLLLLLLTPFHLSLLANTAYLQHDKNTMGVNYIYYIMPARAHTDTGIWNIITSRI